MEYTKHYIYLHLLPEEGRQWRNWGSPALRVDGTYSVRNLEMSSVTSVLRTVCMHAFRASAKWRVPLRIRGSGVGPNLGLLRIQVDQNTSAQIAECLTLLLRTLIITRRWEVT